MNATTITTCVVLTAFLATPAWAGYAYLRRAEQYERKYHEKLEDAQEEAAEGDWDDYRRDLARAERYRQRAEYYRHVGTHGGGDYYAPTRYRSNSGRYSDGYPYYYRAPSRRSYRYYGHPSRGHSSRRAHPRGSDHGFFGRGHGGTRRSARGGGHRSYGRRRRSHGGHRSGRRRRR